MPSADIAPTFSDVSACLRIAMAAALQGEDVVYLPPDKTADPDIRKILVMHKVSPGRPESGELGGRLGLAAQPGSFAVTFSFPSDDLAIAGQAAELAEQTARHFYRQNLETPAGCRVLCGETYITNAGQTPDSRISLLVTVPYWTWTGGLDG